MDAHEAVAEFLFERGERFLDQVFTLARAHRDVFQFGLQVDDLLQRHQDDATTLVHRQVTTTGVGGLGQRVDGIQMLGRDQRAGTQQRSQQTLGAHGLEQVVQCVDFEGINRKFVEGRDEDHQRHRLGIAAVTFAGTCGNVACQLDAGHARHLHVHQYHLRTLRLDLRQCFGRVGCLADDAMRKLRRQIGQNLSQPGARRRLVINDQD